MSIKVKTKVEIKTFLQTGARELVFVVFVVKYIEI